MHLLARKRAGGREVDRGELLHPAEILGRFLCVIDSTGIFNPAPISSANNSLLVSLRLIKARYFTEHCI
jgi:hypothetical protein